MIAKIFRGDASVHVRREHASVHARREHASVHVRRERYSSSEASLWSLAPQSESSKY